MTVLTAPPVRRRWKDVSTDHIDAGGVRYAYRSFGTEIAEPPLVLLHRFRGTMDDWDPLLLNLLARHRHVLAFDNGGVGRSTGAVPPTIAGMAASAVSFLHALGIDQVDLLGWSMGRAVAQRIALDHPHLVRRLVLAGTGPGGVPDAPPAPAKVLEVASKPVNEDEDFLYLFFPEHPDGRAAGLAHLARLGHGRPRGPAVDAAGIAAQIRPSRPGRPVAAPPWRGSTRSPSPCWSPTASTT